jgi:ParB/RepB/Spo0J family partition protein
MAYNTKMMKVEDLQEYPNNPRNNKESIEKVAMSIKEVGWRVPIIVDEDMVILAGHTRLKAAKLLGFEQVPVHKAEGLSEAQKTAFRIMDNKSQDFSEWDNDLLAEEFGKLADQNYDLDQTGFSFEEIEKMTSDMIEFTEPEEIVTDIDTSQFDDLQTSNVRMVNIFLNQETEPKFQDMVAFLREKWSKENLTETVYEAVEKTAKNEGF